MTLRLRSMLMSDCGRQVPPVGAGYTLCRGFDLNANAAEVRLQRSMCPVQLQHLPDGARNE